MSRILRLDNNGFYVEKINTKAKIGQLYEKGKMNDENWLKSHHVVSLSYETHIHMKNVYETSYSAILENGEIVFGLNITDKQSIKPFILKALETNTDYKNYSKTLK